MTVYIDKDYMCHPEQTGALTPVETDFFNGKCPEFIEGYRLIPEGHSWTREDGITFHGPMTAPRTDYRELDAAQRRYEQEQLARLTEAMNILITGGNT